MTPKQRDEELARDLIAEHKLREELPGSFVTLIEKSIAERLLTYREEVIDEIYDFIMNKGTATGGYRLKLGAEIATALRSLKDGGV